MTVDDDDGYGFPVGSGAVWTNIHRRESSRSSVGVAHCAVSG